MLQRLLLEHRHRVTVLGKLLVSPTQLHLPLQLSRAGIRQDLVLDVTSDNFLVLTLYLLVETIVRFVRAEMSATYSVTLGMFRFDAFAVSSALLSQLYAVRFVVPNLFLPFAFFSFVHPAFHVVVLCALKQALTVLILDFFLVSLHAVAQDVLVHAKRRKRLDCLGHPG